ncbi:hypothetical protein SARC_03766 [Sphaeroforma arctica JP610]|uniref:SRCR domain-containing protein n=1 Tax=Sphaeroforma arctica JP610 TaxID=667725 RepID=A0A0L0G4N3_9EUKA|nr:hypothetical protein SARC_03766 [Sphaeroforma arctica JP610]KNC84005.1 hypothetical protein SARC_03766 [Sphaeroforma arctica JP610]|eukprot:XP_014157907.1 hypothetical protein SARC_03766 [Sphaeroforma arctica JP610]
MKASSVVLYALWLVGSLVSAHGDHDDEDHTHDDEDHTHDDEDHTHFITIELYGDTTACDSPNPTIDPVELDHCYRGSTCNGSDCPDQADGDAQWEMLSLMTDGDGEEILVLQTYKDEECTSLLMQEEKEMNKCKVLGENQSVFYGPYVTVSDTSSTAGDSDTTVAEADTANETQTVIADADTANGTQTVIADADTSNGTQTVIADADTANGTQTVIADADTANGTQTVIADADTANGTQTVIADADTANGTQTVIADDSGKEVQVTYYLNAACEGEDLRDSIRDFDINSCYFEHEDELPYYFKWEHLLTDGESRLKKSYYLDNKCLHVDPDVAEFNVLAGACNKLGVTNSIKISLQDFGGPQVGFGFD